MARGAVPSGDETTATSQPEGDSAGGRRRGLDDFDSLERAAALGALVVAVASASSAPDAADLAWLVLASIPFLFALAGVRFGLISLAVAAIGVGAFALAGGDPISTTLPGVAIFVAMQSLSPRTGLVATGLIAAMLVAVAVVDEDLAWAAAGVGMFAAWGVGVSVARLRIRFENVRTAETNAAEQAVRAERRHLAREVHDLVAHTLTGTMLNLMEVRLTLDSNRDAALRALDEAESLARSSLADLRGIVRLLSEEGDPELQPPIELETDLERLVDSYRRAGVSVTLETIGAPVPLSIASAWGVYRVVQESLTNAARHVPGAPIEVTLTWVLDGARFVIANHLAPNGSPPAPTSDTAGRGLVGMSERVLLLGGRVEAGPTRTGWTVSAWIPASPGPPIEMS